MPGHTSERAAADGRERPDPETVTDQAARVVLSYRAADRDADADDWQFAGSDWILEGANEPSYLRYLRHARAGPVAVGDEFEEFLNRGCSSRTDVILRVERVEGGSAIGADTELEIVHRADAVGKD